MADELTPVPSDPCDAAGGAPVSPPESGARVSRSVEVDAGIAEVWHAVADPRERSLWLDDPDAASRRVRVDETTPGQSLVWTWWRPGDEGGASTVSVVLSPLDGGRTRVVVTETARAVPPLGGSRGGAPARAALATSTGTARRPPAWVHRARGRWGSRLLGLELLFVAARAVVA